MFFHSNLSKHLQMSKKFLNHMRNPAKSPALLWKQGKGFSEKPKTFIAFYSVLNPRSIATLYYCTVCLVNCLSRLFTPEQFFFYLSIFRKPYFIGRFLPALLTPRKVRLHVFFFLAQMGVLKIECRFTSKTATQM